MSVTTKDVDEALLEQLHIPVGERTWRFRTTLPACQIKADADRLRIVAIYRARACECLERARLARDEGFVAAALGYIDEAETWRQFANQWARLSTSSTPHHDPSARR
jgi:hypothetical protein